MNSSDELRQHIGWCFGMGSGLPSDRPFTRRHSLGVARRLRFGHIFPDFRCCLRPVLNCCTVRATLLLVEFISLPRDARRQVSRCLGFGPGLSLRLCLWIHSHYAFRSRFSLGLWFRHRLGVTLRSGIRVDCLGFKLRFGSLGLDWPALRSITGVPFVFAMAWVTSIIEGRRGL